MMSDIAITPKPKPKKNITIRKRLIIMIMVVSQTILLMVSAIVMYLSYHSERRDLTESIIAASNIITDYSIDALKSKDPDKTWEGLKSLRAMDTVNIVCMYDAERFYFSGYAINPEVTGVCPVVLDDVPNKENMEVATNFRTKVDNSSAFFRAFLERLVEWDLIDLNLMKASDELDFSFDKILVSHDRYQISVLTQVNSKNKNYGFLYVSANMLRIWEYLWNVLGITATLMVFGTIFSLVMTSYMHKLITVPISRLIGAATDLAESTNYDVRAPHSRIEDINILVDAFNMMIERIQERDRLLLISKLEADESREEAELSKVEAQKASRMKSEFLANMSHELRTPLNSLLILAEYFRRNKDGNLNKHQIQDADTIYSSGKDLLLLINDILDLSKVEAGKMDVHCDEIDTVGIITSIEKKFRPVAKERKLYFTTKIDDSVPSCFVSDKIRVEQIIRNFLSNAFKFTDEGGVTIAVSLADPHTKFNRDDLRASRTVAISVIDTGIGIPEDKKEVIFKAFQQADGTTSRKYGGTGLGLSICMRFSQLLGGEIAMESIQGKETKFTLYLPFIMEGASEELIKSVALRQKEEAVKGKSLTFDTRETGVHYPDIAETIKKRKTDQPLMLIIEDDMKFADILRSYFMEKNFAVIMTDTAEMGLFHVKNYNPDILMVDFELPGMNGNAFIEEFRKDKQNIDVPYVMMSNIPEAISSHQGKALTLINKPVSEEIMDDLLDKIVDYVKEYRPEYTIRTIENIEESIELEADLDAHIEETSSAIMVGIRKALLIDSSVRDIYRLTPILKNMGCEVLAATNNQKALEEIEKHDDIDIILVDSDMKGLRNPSLNEDILQLVPNIPVVLMSNEAIAGELKGNKQLQKTLDNNEIQLELKKLLAVKEA